MLFKCLIGSQNYGLDTPESDKDYMVYHCPTFDDLYHEKSICREEKSCEGIIYHKDVRSLSNMIHKASFNQLEILCSKEIIVGEDSAGKLFNWMKDRRDEIAMANIPRLFKSCIGELEKRLHDFRSDKYPKSSQYLVDRYGYDTKNVMHAFRLSALLSNIYIYKNSLAYSFHDLASGCFENKKQKVTLMDIREGVLSKDKVSDEITHSLLEMKTVEAQDLLHKNFPPKNEKLAQELENKIYDFIKTDIRKQI